MHDNPKECFSVFLSVKKIHLFEAKHQSQFVEVTGLSTNQRKFKTTAKCKTLNSCNRGFLAICGVKLIQILEISRGTVS